MTIDIPQQKKHYRNRNADDLQAEVYKKFPPNSFLGDERNVDNFMQWMTFFRRNLHRFVSDYLGIKLHLYQSIMIYLMGVCQFVVVVASRASAKSFIIALYACCRCILYPNSMIVISSAKKFGIPDRNIWVIKVGCVGETHQYIGQYRELQYQM